MAQQGQNHATVDIFYRMMNKMMATAFRRLTYQEINERLRESAWRLDAYTNSLSPRSKARVYQQQNEAQQQAPAAAQQNVLAPVQNGPQPPVLASGATAGQAAQASQSAPVQLPAATSGSALPPSVPAFAAPLSTSTVQQTAVTTPATVHNGPQAPAPGPGLTITQGVQAAQVTNSAIVQPSPAVSGPALPATAPAVAAAVQSTQPTVQQAAPAALVPQALAQTQASQLAAAHRLTPWAYQPAPPFPPGLHVLTPPEVLARYPTGIPLQNGMPQLGPNEVLPPNIQVLPPAPRQTPIPITQNMTSYIGTTQIPQHIVNYVQILRTQSLGLSSTQARTTRQRFDRTGPPAAQHVFNNKWGVLQNHNTKRPGGRLFAELFDYWMDYRIFDHDEWWELITRPSNHGQVWPHAPWQVNVL